jgi:aldose 1-epimerase
MPASSHTDVAGRFSAHVRHDAELDAPLVELRYDDGDPSRVIQVAVAPTLGSNLAQFRVGGHEVFLCDRPALKRGDWTGCFVLWPLPNRHDHDGAKGYEFGGRFVDLDDIVRKEDDRFLIHGLVDDQPWTYEPPVVGEDAATVTTSISIEPGSDLHRHFPWHSRLDLTYTLRADGVAVTYTVHNLGEEDLPSVFALHPYYRLPGGPGAVRVRIPARERMPANDQTVPSGELLPVTGTAHDLREGRAVAGMTFDDVWTGLETGEDTYVEFDEPPLRIRHVVSEDFTHVVLYTLMTETLGFLCLEPQTGSSNALNLHARAVAAGDATLTRAAHLVTVPAGRSVSGTAAFVVQHLRAPA